MTLGEFQTFLFWCAGLNYAILMIWFLVFVFARDWIFRMHTRWFKISAEVFDAANYMGMAIYKIGVLLFNVVPLIALYVIGTK